MAKLDYFNAGSDDHSEELQSYKYMESEQRHRLSGRAMGYAV